MAIIGGIPQEVSLKCRNFEAQQRRWNRPAPRLAVRISCTHPRSTSSKHPAAEAELREDWKMWSRKKVAVLMVETCGNLDVKYSGNHHHNVFLQKLATPWLPQNPISWSSYEIGRTRSPSKSPQPHPNPRGWKTSSPRDLDRHSMSVQDLV